MPEKKINYDKLSKEEIIALLQTLDEKELRSLLSKVEKRKFADFVDKLYKEEIDEDNLKRYVKWRWVEKPMIEAGIVLSGVILLILTILFSGIESLEGFLFLFAFCFVIFMAGIGAYDLYCRASIFSKSEQDDKSEPSNLDGTFREKKDS